MTVSVSKVIMQLPILSGTLSLGIKKDSQETTRKMELGKYVCIR